MKLNHIHLTVTDVLVAIEFLERYFGMNVLEKRNSGLTVMLDIDTISGSVMVADFIRQFRKMER